MPTTNSTNQPTSLIWVQGNKLQLALPLQIVTFTDDGKTEEDYNPPTGSTILVCLAGKFRCFRYTPTISDGNVLHIVDNGELPADSYSVTIIVEEPNGTKRRCKWNYVINVYDSNEKVTDYFDDFPDWGQGAILQGSIFYGTGGGGGGGVQSDWNQTDTTALDYIKNKPSLPVSGATNGNFAGLDASGNVTDSGKKASDFAAASHTHGNISNAGAITTNAAIANGDRLVFSDSSASSKLVRHSTTFDGSTTTTALTPKGTFEAFYKKPSTGIPASDLESGVIPDVSGKEDKSNKVTSLSSASTDTQYPSAKCVYDLVGDVETLLAAI